MRRPLARPSIAVLAVLCLAFGSACSGKDKQVAAVSSSTTTSTTEAPTTTTTTPPRPAPLTGQPLTDAAVLARPALVVKIDTAPEARPQSGIDLADVVYEEQVEGGVVRFMAVFHSRDAELVGPVRSVRPVDPDIVSPLQGLFAYSGGAPQFVALIKRAPVKLVGFDELTSAYDKRSGKRAPHNLYTSTKKLFAAAGDKKAPPPLFSYLAAGQAFGGAGVAPLTHADVTMGGQTRATWDWDPAVSLWRRGTNGTAHVVEAGQQLSFANVVVQFVRYRNTGSRDPSGAPVPTADVIGTGTAWVFSAGQVVKGTYSKKSAAAITEYKDSAGVPIALSPGATWVSLAPAGTPTALR
jgi:hypothetical protein